MSVLTPCLANAGCPEIRHKVSERAISLHDYRIIRNSLRDAIEIENDESKKSELNDQLKVTDDERRQLIRRIEEDGKRLLEECSS